MSKNLIPLARFFALLLLAAGFSSTARAQLTLPPDPGTVMAFSRIALEYIICSDGTLVFGNPGFAPIYVNPSYPGYFEVVANLENSGAQLVSTRPITVAGGGLTGAGVITATGWGVLIVGGGYCIYQAWQLNDYQSQIAVPDSQPANNLNPNEDWYGNYGSVWWNYWFGN